MPVQKKFRLVLFHQRSENLKALMRKIPPVVQLISRGMRHQNIKAPPPKQLKPQPGHPLFHFTFRILVRPGLVPHGAAEPQNPHSFVYKYFILYAGTALRRYLLVLPVMVSVYIKHRPRIKGHQKGKVARVQIAAGDNQINSLQHAPVKIIPQRL